MTLTIGKNIKKLREERKVTQEKLASALNISFQAVSKWENEVAVPDTTLLPQIASFFQVTIDDLFQNDMEVYANLAIRLLAVYEQSHDQKDFYRANLEFAKMVNEGIYTEDDIRCYGVLYEYHSKYCIDKALELYQKSLDMGEVSKSKNFYSTQRQRIQMLAYIGRGQENIKRHMDLLQKEPDNVENHISLIMAYYQEKQYERALEMFQETIKRWPHNATLYVFGGDICRKQKCYDKALEYFNKALELNDNICDAMYSKAFCYQEMGNNENELKTWKVIVEWLEMRGFTIQTAWPNEMIKKLNEKIGEYNHS